MKKYSFLFALVVLVSSFTYHIMKISNTTITKSEGKLNIEIKLFADDLTETMKSTGYSKLNYNKASLTAKDKEELQKYIAKNFSIQLNGTAQSIEFIDATTDLKDPNNSVIVVKYKSVNNIGVNKGSKLKIKNTLLFEAMAEQRNMVTLLNLVGGEIEVLNFACKDKDVFQEFVY